MNVYEGKVKQNRLIYFKLSRTSDNVLYKKKQFVAVWKNIQYIVNALMSVAPEGVGEGSRRR